MKTRIQGLIKNPVRFILGITCGLLLLPSLIAQNATTGKLAVKVGGIRNTDGNIRIALQNAPNQNIDRRIAEIDAKTMTAEAVFTDLKPGVYAVAVFHDENKNGTMDFESTGMPSEGYGHSNNPEKRMGPPSFDETKFTLDGQPKALEIQMIYWP